jgi:hypothetical protein
MGDKKEKKFTYRPHVRKWKRRGSGNGKREK